MWKGREEDSGRTVVGLVEEAVGDYREKRRGKREAPLGVRVATGLSCISIRL